MGAAPTLNEVRKWPATVPVTDAARAIGCSRSQLYELIRRGEAPVKVLSFGTRHRVVTASLVRLLEAA
ncbi:helix-turn-helix domain-containing protein [Streptomyces argyrophyllae]|uniref:Helix-turn-helix domain-containing protein n=1 Tax=Streptomyces argyrophylli TaxID=2726118 RepID=A0A6M4PRH0_9ACTN|nr:helix-turn-helix domain-containing protein [Streptomyces argyrophyllae]QJS13224.1 helix-turn-helix domain-containing protein [Streptomyces argyrophyllae]